jgi:hypothetical protein
MGAYCFVGGSCLYVGSFLQGETLCVGGGAYTCAVA